MTKMFRLPHREQTIRWTRRADFPKPAARLSMGPIWMRRDVEEWWDGPDGDAARGRLDWGRGRRSRWMPSAGSTDGPPR